MDAASLPRWTWRGARPRRVLHVPGLVQATIYIVSVRPVAQWRARAQPPGFSPFWMIFGPTPAVFS
jgi:hypothetical protein